MEEECVFIKLVEAKFNPENEIVYGNYVNTHTARVQDAVRECIGGQIIFTVYITSIGKCFQENLKGYLPICS